MSALIDGRARTASQLARAAGITPQTASSHLAKLTAAGLLSVVVNGRHRHFRLASPTVVEMIEGIAAVALLARPRARPLSREAHALDAARICYDHLGGRLSVDLADALVARGHVVLHDDVAEVTAAGRGVFAAFGIDLPGRRPTILSRLCLDWTERRPHVAGALGAAMTARCLELRWIERLADSQAVHVTPLGRRGFLKTFGVDATREASTLRSSSKRAERVERSRM
jgi:hypothetical protein